MKGLGLIRMGRGGVRLDWEMGFVGGRVWQGYEMGLGCLTKGFQWIARKEKVTGWLVD